VFISPGGRRPPIGSIEEECHLPPLIKLE